MGDAILSTAALKAMRKHFASDHITFFASPVVRQALSPTTLADAWLDYNSRNPFVIARELSKYNFTHAVLFKNSFLCAMSAFLARIPERIGYARDCRSLFLTQKLYPPKNPDGSFKPISVVDYYIAITASLGATAFDKFPVLDFDPAAKISLLEKLPALKNRSGPLVVLVPGGAFGPSKLWPSERFAATADYLIEKYNAQIVISVAPNEFEKAIANNIRSSAKHELIDLSACPVSLGQLKALIAQADLVITNDTGPRHIAIALGKKLITLFGPNNPLWTATGYAYETQLVGQYPCVHCDKPKCKYDSSRCMETITVEMVTAEADKILSTIRGAI